MAQEVPVDGKQRTRAAHSRVRLEGKPAVLPDRSQLRPRRAKISESEFGRSMQSSVPGVLTGGSAKVHACSKQLQADPVRVGPGSDLRTFRRPVARAEFAAKGAQGKHPTITMTPPKILLTEGRRGMPVPLTGRMECLRTAADRMPERSPDRLRADYSIHPPFPPNKPFSRRLLGSNGGYTRQTAEHAVASFPAFPAFAGPDNS